MIDMKLSKTQLLCILSALFFLASIAVLGWFIFQIVHTGQLLTQRVEAIAGMNASLKTNAELEQLMGETAQEREVLAGLILTEEDTSVFLTRIEQIASEVGVELATRSLTVIEREEETYDLLSLSLQIEGSHDRVLTMLEVLEVLPYHSVVDGLRFTHDPSMTTQAEVDVKVTLKK